MTTTETAITPGRQALIEGLRELATFLEQRPELPINSHAEVSYCVFAHDDTAGLRQLTEIADAIDVEVTDVGGRAPTGDETHFYARRRFGRARYEATYITRARMADHNALMSYRDSIRAEVSETTA